MITKKNTVSLTDLKRKTKDVMQSAQTEDGPLYVMDRTSPVGVIMNLEDYNALIKNVEDLQDAYELLLTDKKGTILLDSYDKNRSNEGSSN